jgi:hypothetical protein
VLTIPLVLLTTHIRRVGRPRLLLLFLLSIRQRDRISLVLRLKVLGENSGGRTIVGEEVQDILLYLVVGEVVFRRQVFYITIIGFCEHSQKKIIFCLLISI